MIRYVIIIFSATSFIHAHYLFGTADEYKPAPKQLEYEELEIPNIDELINTENKPNEELHVNDWLETLERDKQNAKTSKEVEEIARQVQKTVNSLNDQDKTSMEVFYHGAKRLINLGLANSSGRMKSIENAEFILTRIWNALKSFGHTILRFFGIEWDSGEDDKDKDKKKKESEKSPESGNKTTIKNPQDLSKDPTKVTQESSTDIKTGKGNDKENEKVQDEGKDKVKGKDKDKSAVPNQTIHTNTPKDKTATKSDTPHTSQADEEIDADLLARIVVQTAMEYLKTADQKLSDPAQSNGKHAQVHTGQQTMHLGSSSDPNELANAMIATGISHSMENVVQPSATHATPAAATSATAASISTQEFNKKIAEFKTTAEGNLENNTALEILQQIDTLLKGLQNKLLKEQAQEVIDVLGILRVKGKITDTEFSKLLHAVSRKGNF